MQKKTIALISAIASLIMFVLPLQITTRHFYIGFSSLFGVTSTFWGADGASTIRIINWIILIISIVLIIIICNNKEEKKSYIAFHIIDLIMSLLYLTEGIILIVMCSSSYHPITLSWLAFIIQLALLIVSFTSNTVSASNENDNSEYVDMMKHVLLLLFTFGIYLYIWIYRTTAYLNKCNKEEYRNPTNKLLLCLFVPFYYIYWTYKTAQMVDRNAKAKNVVSDISTLCLILAIFIGIIPPILIQDKINATIKIEETKDIPVSSTTVSQSPASNISSADELKKYKDLLDDGIITQEEFDAKKKQLLGL